MNSRLTWYKKAKMANKAINSGDKIYTVCQFCKRWKTVPDQVDARSSETQWKKENQLTPEEKLDIESIYKASLKGLGSSGISHGVCDTCYDLIKKYGYPNNGEINSFIEQSLELS